MKIIIFLLIFNSISFLYCSEHNNSAYEALLSNSSKAHLDRNLKTEIDYTNKKISVYHIDQNSGTETEVYKTSSSETLVKFQITKDEILIKIEKKGFWKRTYRNVKIDKSDGTVTISNCYQSLVNSSKNYGTNDD